MELKENKKGKMTDEKLTKVSGGANSLKAKKKNPELTRSSVDHFNDDIKHK